MNLRIPLIAGIIVATSVSAWSQETPGSYRNFPVIVSLQFHALTLPFRDMRGNFANVGLAVGTEVGLDKKNNFVQQIMAGWHRNKTVGNGLMVYTQAAWRPTISGNFFSEIKAGAGYLYSFRPTDSFRQENGSWVSVGHKGKGMLTVPLGISFGYQPYSETTYLSPFISYQFMIVSGYNTSLPVVPETLIQVGSRIHLQY